MNFIEVVGIVVREKRREEQCSKFGTFSRIDYFTIDDGTGLLDCKIYNRVLWECMRMGENVIYFSHGLIIRNHSFKNAFE